jgi:hypothetical protein
MRLVNLAAAEPGSAGRAGLPEPVEDGFRGVAIHWVSLAPPTTKRRKRLAPTIAVPTWAIQRVRFAVLNPDRSDSPPPTEVIAHRMVRHAYALAASHFPIPADATVYFEIRT